MCFFYSLRYAYDLKDIVNRNCDAQAVCNHKNNATSLDILNLCFIQIFNKSTVNISCIKVILFLT